jgi:hypothetical protein
MITIPSGTFIRGDGGLCCCVVTAHGAPQKDRDDYEDQEDWAQA